MGSTVFIEPRFKLVDDRKAPAFSLGNALCREGERESNTSVLNATDGALPALLHERLHLSVYRARRALDCERRPGSAERWRSCLPRRSFGLGESIAER
jgi:hypothetical protein